LDGRAVTQPFDCAKLQGIKNHAVISQSRGGSGWENRKTKERWDIEERQVKLGDCGRLKRKGEHEMGARTANRAIIQNSRRNQGATG